jgi:pSer/pThr/pTyr-binding forkhead associated (FHA) protein
MRRLNEEMKREHEALVKSLRKRTSRKAESARGMRLRFDDREVLVGERHPSVSVGRGEDKDIVVTGERVSLMHARIEFSGNKFVLIDQSTNGTYVQSADGKESFIRRGSSQLTGQGMIGLGARPRQGSTHTIGFTCEDV